MTDSTPSIPSFTPIILQESDLIALKTAVVLCRRLGREHTARQLENLRSRATKPLSVEEKPR